MTTGERIKNMRKNRGITQEELGNRLGVSGSMIAQYETDKRNPKVETLERIASALGVHVFDLLGVGEQLDPYVQNLDNIAISGTISASEFKNVEQRLASMTAAEMFNTLPVEQKCEFIHMFNAMAACNEGHIEKQKLVPTDGDELDEIDRRLMQYVRKMTPEQKQLLLAQMQVLSEQNQP